MKLSQYVAQATGISRRKANEELKLGKIKKNGKIAEFWEGVNSKKDIIEYKGKKVKLSENTTMVILNKPVGYITTRSNKYNEKTVMDLLPENLQNLKPIGRLDADSEGLLVLTDDGEKIYEWTHPKFEHEKEYLLTFKKPITEELMQKFIKGVELEEGLAVVDYIERVGLKELNVVIHQGWKRQLRRMAKKSGNEIVKLKRIRMSNIVLDDIKTGKWKKI